MVEMEVEIGMEWDNHKNLLTLNSSCDIFSWLDTFFSIFSLICYIIPYEKSVVLFLLFAFLMYLNKSSGICIF